MFFFVCFSFKENMWDTQKLIILGKKQKKQQQQPFNRNYGRDTSKVG